MRNEDLVPHSCGELCGKQRGNDCPHRCAELCHPGRCPPCTSTVIAKCPCGRESRRQRCGEALVCEAKCLKELSCGRHHCQDTCHPGDCTPCQVMVTVVCHCGGSSKEVACARDLESSFLCSSPC